MIFKGCYDKVTPHYSNTYNTWVDLLNTYNIPKYVRYVGGPKRTICQWHSPFHTHDIKTNSCYCIKDLPSEFVLHLYHKSYLYNLHYVEPIYDSVTKTYYFTAYCKFSEIDLSDLTFLAKPNAKRAYILTYDNPAFRLMNKPADKRLEEFLISETRKRFWNDPKYKLADWIR